MSSRRSSSKISPMHGVENETKEPLITIDGAYHGKEQSKTQKNEGMLTPGYDQIDDYNYLPRTVEKVTLSTERLDQLVY